MIVKCLENRLYDEGKKKVLKNYQFPFDIIVLFFWMFDNRIKYRAKRFLSCSSSDGVDKHTFSEELGALIQFDTVNAHTIPARD